MAFAFLIIQNTFDWRCVMEKVNWKEVVQQLTSLLRLSEPPVAMKWMKTEEELMAIPKVRIHKKHMPPCTIVSHAAQFNWTSACKPENIHANYCRGINGMFERDEKWFSGEMFNNVWFDNIEASKAHNRELECVPAKYVALVASPLSSGRLDPPDVVVFHVTPAQAFMLLGGLQVHDFERFQFSFSGESTCSDCWVKTFNTGKPGLGLPCYADKKFAGMSENEVRVSMTPEDTLKALEGLQTMSKNGLRYPIASYSLTSDILEGLPPHYLEF